ncbi:Archaic translocase of outer membrane 12 kDa subunit [Novymonas esmeraldas]|uniref:Archaic translocase of outer membrane 12 kDa subunit n=1 Tax=Novymonas esmeraldas TaxID=1808958 RepID=A0AAW0EKB9_9TRYP
MFIKGAAGKEGAESTAHRLWGFTTSYAKHVGSVYLDFLGPLLLLVAVNMAVEARDNERFGLGWLHCTSLKDDRVREERFPSYEPGSAAQRRRSEAANAIEYAATSV